MDCQDGEGSAVGWFVVCEYWPPGNVIGEFKAEVQDQVGLKSESKTRLSVRMSKGLYVMGVVFLVWAF